MNISPIKTQRDYRNVLKEIEGLMIAKRNTPEGDRLDVLVTLVEAWERKHYPMDLPDPVEAIKYHMDQNGLQPRDLIPFIGSRNRVHEVLNRRRSLTLKMIWRLHEGLGIPAESLIKVGPARAAGAPSNPQRAALKPRALSSSTKTAAARACGFETGSAHPSLVRFSLGGNSTLNLL
jgi:HTH-type transcriptional regulator / antitoxin HigA